jgi:hypothetical protein
LIETRHLDEVWERLPRFKTTMVALELTLNRAEQVLTGLIRLDHEFPQTAAVVLAERSLAGWEQITREAGAVHFIASPRKLEEIALLVRHRVAAKLEYRLSSQEQALPLEEQILADLPWGD